MVLSRHQGEDTNDPLIVNGLMYLCKVIHDALKYVHYWIVVCNAASTWHVDLLCIMHLLSLSLFSLLSQSILFSLPSLNPFSSLSPLASIFSLLSLSLPLLPPVLQLTEFGGPPSAGRRPHHGVHQEDQLRTRL